MHGRRHAPAQRGLPAAMAHSWMICTSHRGSVHCLKCGSGADCPAKAHRFPGQMVSKVLLGERVAHGTSDLDKQHATCAIGPSSPRMRQGTGHCLLPQVAPIVMLVATCGEATVIQQPVAMVNSWKHKAGVL